ncbi:MAG: hypothetical protein GX621_02275 [Pirellulaceae bacterium]|nr:hypothetical protein [Pirellulaceae bacterium]
MANTPQRLDIDFSITWESGWHVGSGYGTPQVDRLVRRAGGWDSPAIVPGAQIKGVLRHRCEQIVAICDPSPGTPLENDMQHAQHFQVVSPHVTPDPEQRQALIANFVPLKNSLLMVDRLFGTRFQGGCLFVEDARPSRDEAKACKYRSMVANRITVDRVTGTARDQRLFSTEVVPQEGNASLYSRIRARHAPDILTQDDDQFPFEYALLLSGLLGIEALGGEKSTGRGRCRIEISPGVLRWNGRALEIADALAGFDDVEWPSVYQLYREEAESDR